MSIKVKLGGADLTDVQRLTLHLTFRSGLETRDPNALQVSLERKVGEKVNDPPDQLAFKLLRGMSDRAGIKTFPGEIEIIDDNENRPIGVWTFPETFVVSCSVSDVGQRIQEVIGLAANKVVYKRSDGQQTPTLDVTI